MVREGEGFLPVNIWVAENPTNPANRAASNAPLSCAANCAPSTDPTTIPGATMRTMSHRTAPRRWCARTLAIEVNRIEANEVATATLTICSAGNASWVNIIVMNGTIIMPPPTPKRPAAKPVHAPSTTSPAISRGSIPNKAFSSGRRLQFDDSASRPKIVFHSGAVIGVIESRLPRRSRIISVRST